MESRRNGPQLSSRHDDDDDAIERCQSNSSATEPGCHGNEILVKIGYNSGCMRDISEIIASGRGFSGSGY